nr:MAG TPA: hypothetical protein [Caudoviricetes sp.]DAS42978.1 MAG TPA: hypothetical protein [Caudoviricetes sp.]
MKTINSHDFTLERHTLLTTLISSVLIIYLL